MTEGCRRAALGAAGVLWIAALLLLVPGTLRAADDLYTVHKVPVDVTAESSVKARERALGIAQQEALSRLLDRLAAEGVSPPAVDRSRVEELVLSLDIDNEKISASRYIADVTVHFNPAAFGGMAAGGVAPGGARPIVVLPVYEWAGVLSLWDELNPWHAAWSRAAATATKPVMVPPAEPATMSALTAQQAVAGERDRIAAVAARYNAVGAIVPRAEYRIDDRTGEAMLQVGVVGYGDAAGATMTERVVARPGEPIDALADRAVAGVLARLDGGGSGSAAGTMPLGGQGGGRDLTVSLAVDGPGDLARVRQRLARVPGMIRSELVSLSRNAARLQLVYDGDLERLRSGLADAGLTLSDGPDGWKLIAAGAGAAPVRPVIPPPFTDRR